jgi:hypothetical protein
MTHNELAELYRIVGGLQASVDAMRGQVSDLMTQWRTQENNASQGRRQVYEKVDALGTQVTVLTTRVDGIAKTYAEVDAFRETATAERHEKIGSKKTIAVIWSVIVAGISGTTALIIEIVHQLWPSGTPPHH